jgi:SAM-dependent methyltransferase
MSVRDGAVVAASTSGPSDTRGGDEIERALGSECPLCHEPCGTVLFRLPYEELWRRLADQFSMRFSAPVIQRNTPTPVATLRECPGCGLQYFSPIAPGDTAFYRELMQAVPYESDRWEFRKVAGLLKEGDALVDFACGDGAFLRAVSPRCARAVGVDRNIDAVSALTGRGLEAYSMEFRAFAEREGKGFDVACAFQVLEHLADVGELLDPMVDCTKPGGRIFVGVPNRERYAAELSAPLDSPPHHVSRWTANQLEALTRRFHLRLRAVHYQPPTYGEAVSIFMSPVDHALSLMPGDRGKRVVRGVLRRAIIGTRRYRLVARTSFFLRHRLYGHTVLGEFDRTTGS